ncbi:MAG: PduL/EutD family phosphate acyltransferase, partial [Oscillospiraceae bacterium]|nr:PduL/EutD family phosphate acyltransferase [Oscillospiraceae bacterium]
LVGPRGMLEAKACAIIARAHIHMTPPDAARFGVHDGQHVRVEVGETRPVTFGDVVVRVKESFSLAMHIDFDEANACLLDPNARGKIIE